MSQRPDLPARPGTYLVQLACDTPVTFVAGKLGELSLEPGTYLYTGSARGPGGLRARLGHHLRQADRPHWHLDYLRRHCRVTSIWYSLSAQADECSWAEAARLIRSTSAPFTGFGSSDCHCPTHLFWRREPPALVTFRQKLRQLGKRHLRIHLFRTADD